MRSHHFIVSFLNLFLLFLLLLLLLPLLLILLHLLIPHLVLVLLLLLLLHLFLLTPFTHSLVMHISSTLPIFNYVMPNLKCLSAY
jgi:hypothetical protein